MKILFTGSSSFTGMWFIKRLAQSGFSVIATYTKEKKAYQGVRKERVNQLKGLCTQIFSAPFGSEVFLDLLDTLKNLNLFCHHGAETENYKSENFNPISAVSINTKNANEVVEKLKKSGCHHILFTGSVFEPREGVGSSPLRAFSPYGLSKAMTFDFFDYLCLKKYISLGKFVIPNPFGPFEEEKFTYYLISNWLEGKTPVVKTGRYVRDNIHINLLAEGYALFVKTFLKGKDNLSFNPSGYVETQEAFTQRVAREMEKRLCVPCNFKVLKQLEENEPMVRANSQSLQALKLPFSEGKAWDAYADYYLYEKAEC